MAPIKPKTASHPERVGTSAAWYGVGSGHSVIGVVRQGIRVAIATSPMIAPPVPH